MTQLTALDDALGETLGLARAARDATARARRGVSDPDVSRTLSAIRGESAEMARRIDEVVALRDGSKTAIRARARRRAQEAREGMSEWVRGDTRPVRSVEGLAVAEAAELAGLDILGGLGLAAGDAAVMALVDWALPLQRRHVTDVRDAGIVLAAQLDPEAAAPAV